MRRRRGVWLVSAVALFGAAALLMSLVGERKQPPPRVKMPRSMDADDLNRLMRRRTLPEAPAPDVPAPDAGVPAEPPRLADPVLRAMPAQIKEAAIVVEASALRYSPVGKLLLACFAGKGKLDVDKLKNELGIDPLVDLDRVSMFDDTFLVSGQLAGAKWGEVFKGARQVALNDHTTLWEPPSGGKVSATWREQMLIMGDDRPAIEAVVARLEGTARAEPPIIPESESYGEVYGAVAPEAFAKLLAREQPALAERLRQVVTGIGLHVDASHDVGLVLDASGAGQDTVDFGKAVGSAMALGRLAAAAQGHPDLARILEYARVIPDGDGKSFRAELALPLTFLEEKLRDCGKSQIDR
jgi:hypothetical protein